MLSLATLPRAPPAALYNPLEHGHNLTDNQVTPLTPVQSSEGLLNTHFITRSQSGLVKSSHNL